jgi:hypothetical protein
MKKLIPAAASLALVLGASVVSAAPANAAAPARAAAPIAKAAQDDDTVVLPGRVAGALRRTQNSLNNAEQHIDEGEYTQAVTSLRGVRRNMYRADKAARHQMNAIADPDAETTPGPDSVVAVLTMDSTAVETLSGLFDTNSKGVVIGLTHALYRTMNARDKLLDSVIALDPEGAGADYSDGMADTVDGYADEVSTLQEAVTDDTLSTGGRLVLSKALAQSQATAGKVNLAFGGGE